MNRPFTMRDRKVIAWLAAIAVVTLAVGALFPVSVWIVIAGVVSWSWGALQSSIVRPRLIDEVPKYTWPQGVAVGTGVTLVIVGLAAAILRYAVVSS